MKNLVLIFNIFIASSVFGAPILNTLNHYDHREVLHSLENHKRTFSALDEEQSQFNKKFKVSETEYITIQDINDKKKTNYFDLLNSVEHLLSLFERIAKSNVALQTELDQLIQQNSSLKSKTVKKIECEVSEILAKQDQETENMLVEILTDLGIHPTKAQIDEDLKRDQKQLTLLTKELQVADTDLKLISDQINETNDVLKKHNEVLIDLKIEMHDKNKKVTDLQKQISSIDNTTDTVNAQIKRTETSIKQKRSKLNQAFNQLKYSQK